MVEVVFNKNGIVVFIGLFGCGKLMVVIYLIWKELYDWIFRKLYLLEELVYIDDDKFLVFIDNIFFCRMMDLDFGSWWDELDRIYEKYFVSYDVEDKLNCFCIVMIVRLNVIEKVCIYMGKVILILYEMYLMDVSKFIEKEKNEILEK